MPGAFDNLMIGDLIGVFQDWSLTDIGIPCILVVGRLEKHHPSL